MKKILLGVLVSASIFACKNSETKEIVTTEQAPATIEHIYKPTYTDNFKIGDQKNVLIAEQMHQAIFAKDFKKIAEFLSDTVLFSMEDGTTIKGKEAGLAYMEKAFAGMNVKNYSMTGEVPIVGENGHQWVIMFDRAEVETPDGKTQTIEWVDSFRFLDGKVVHMNGYAKSPKQ
ncbi:MAG: nuclear transport factor 2 family protein [Chitinophagaceae bacterium]